MLRILSENPRTSIGGMRIGVKAVVFLGAALFVTGSALGNENLEQASRASEAASAESQSAIADAESTGIEKELPSFGDAADRASVVPNTSFPTLSDDLTDPDTLNAIGELMDNAKTMAADLGIPAAGNDGLTIYVFASFSMPNASLRALIEQGELAEAPVVLRGLVNNSIEETMIAVRALYGDGEKQESGAVIDPTLFERFDVDQVPAVVVARSAATACTPESCPTPDHVKIAGDVPLRYSLDRIALAKPDYRHELRVVMKRLEPERQW